jgi:class 3 adenylate cyclase
VKYATSGALGGAVTFRSPRSASTSDGSLGRLATQTLTFLFTDVEGSTALLTSLGDRYAEVLADHHQLIRASLAAHGGEEVDTQGDAFFAVFSSPSACATAAIEMQRAFLSHRWPAGEAVRVRMGVHSGEASQSAVGLVGLGIHRAARVAAVGHGGQILVSATTAALLGDSMPAGASLRDLGSHRLKDLGRPEQIFQLDADGLLAVSRHFGRSTTRSCGTTSRHRCPASSAATLSSARCRA